MEKVRAGEEDDVTERVVLEQASWACLNSSSCVVDPR